MSWLKNKSSFSAPSELSDFNISHKGLKFFLLLFLIFSNFWMIKILSINFFLGIFLSVFCIAAIFFENEQNSPSDKKIILLSGILILCFLQFYLTGFTNLNYLDNDSQRVKEERIKSYPLLYIPIFTKAVWIKPEWIESNFLIFTMSKIEVNTFSFFDLNYYFFGGYPRNLPSDYEKIPFVLLPFFIVGVLNLLKRKKYEFISVLTIPVFLISVIVGENKIFGPFSLFPFLIISIYYGTLFAAKKFNYRLFYPLLLVSILLILILQISYAYA